MTRVSSAKHRWNQLQLSRISEFRRKTGETWKQIKGKERKKEEAQSWRCKQILCCWWGLLCWKRLELFFYTVSRTLLIFLGLRFFPTNPWNYYPDQILTLKVFNLFVGLWPVAIRVFDVLCVQTVIGVSGSSAYQMIKDVHNHCSSDWPAELVSAVLVGALDDVSCSMHSTQSLSRSQAQP